MVATGNLRNQLGISSLGLAGCVPLCDQAERNCTDEKRGNSSTDARPGVHRSPVQLTGFSAAPNPQSSSRAGVMSVSPPGPTVSRSAWPKPLE